MRAFVISDIHGMRDPFLALLRHWNPNDLLIILGDMLDRGQYSYEVVLHVRNLHKKYPDKVIVIGGNHEQMFLDFLEVPHEFGGMYLNNGGTTTILSFTQLEGLLNTTYDVQADILNRNFKEEIAFLKQSRSYYEFGKVLFTHAGFNSLEGDWKDTEDYMFKWIRNHYKHPNTTGLVNVFGHTNTHNIHKTNDIWVSKCKTYIGIDGACAVGGQLNGLLINDAGEILETYYETHKTCKEVLGIVE